MTGDVELVRSTAPEKLEGGQALKTAHPAWYLNLVTSANAEVEVDGRRLNVWATELSDDDAERWWRRILEVAPDYERYARAARRTFPILRLAPS